MESINLVCVAKVFLNLIQSQFEDSGDITSDEHFQIAEILVEKLHEIVYEYVFVDENVNIEGGYKSTVEYKDDDGNEILKEEVSLEYKCKAVKAFKEHKGKWKFQTFQKKYPRLLHPYYIQDWEKQINMGGTKFELHKKIEDFVMDKFQYARQECLTVHDFDFRRWGMQISREFKGFNFKASESWVSNLKRRNGIISRKVQKVMSHRAIREKDKLQETAIAFREEMKPLLIEYNAASVWNTDQTGFKYEHLDTRTLSWKGERSTYGSGFSPKNKATHSYTVQYVIALSGNVIGDAFVCLQESKGILGPRVKDSIFTAPNLTVSCSTSGKLTTGHVKYFLDHVVKPHAVGKVLYITDKWTGHTDPELYNTRFRNEIVDMTVKFIPENCTDICQPLDTYFHRELKFLAKQFYNFSILHQDEHLDAVLTSRNGILKMQSLIHYLLSAKAFQPMIQYCWYSSGLWYGEKPSFKNVKDVCFNLADMKCSTQECQNSAFIKCSVCLLNFCFSEFFHDYHVVICTKSTFV